MSVHPGSVRSPIVWSLYPKSELGILICSHLISFTMRMAIRRSTLLTNAFSKKPINLEAAVALLFAYYNFCRVDTSLA
jgi:hypothetical protein